jgi:thiol-disulfide isomerase/thioredoxin
MKVINIESNNIDDFENVIQEMPAFVKIFSPSCGHCSDMAPAWNALKNDDELKNLNFALVAINSSAVGEMKSKGVKSFNGVPTMR